jgi:hypothetical protein
VRLLSIDGRSFGRDRAALAEAISAAGADVTCIHGSPHLLRWRSISAAIGRQAGMVVVTGGRLAGANLLLSTLSVDVSAVRDARLAKGGAALAALKFRGTEFVLVSASLVGDPAERLTQARALQAEIDHLVPGDPPAIISAEGADRPGVGAWPALVEYRVSVARQIFVDGRIGVEQTSDLADGSAAGTIVELSL